MLPAFALALLSLPSARFVPRSPLPSTPAVLPDGAEEVAFPDYGLTLKLPPLESLEQGTPTASTCKGAWKGRLGASEVEVSLHVLPTSTYDFFEPEDVVELWRDSLRDLNDKDSEAQDIDFRFRSVRVVPGTAGASPIVATVEAGMKKKDASAAEGTLFLVGGLLPENGWALRVDAWPALDAANTKAIGESLTRCAAYKGKPRDPKWTDAEALAYWKRFAPEDTHKKYEKPVRTEHFIVLTNSTSPGPFVKKLEGWYTAIRKVVPFEDPKGRRLLPVLLFRTGDQFDEFYRIQFKMDSLANVNQTSSSVGPWLATSCDNDDESDLLLLTAKQIMVNRARAWGGVTWFRSGLRNYIAWEPDERAEGVRAIKNKKHTPLEKLLDDQAWSAQSSKIKKRGVSDETSYWAQSALWIEFFRDGPFPKDTFPRFVQTVGSLPDGDRPGVVAALQEIYGMDPMGLEKKWIAFFSKK